MTTGNWKATFTILLGALCCGCQATYDTTTAMTAYQNAKSCCSNFLDMNFEKLAYGKSLSIGIALTDQAYQFADGLSYFRAFELPSFPAKSAIIAESTQFLNPANKSAVYFYPVFTVLDEQKKPIATINRFSEAAAVDGYIHANSPSTLEIGFLSNEYPKARYVVLHTTAALISTGHKIHYRLPVLNVDVLGSAVAGRPVQSDATMLVPGSPVAPKGTLEVRVVPAQ